MEGSAPSSAPQTMTKPSQQATIELNSKSPLINNSTGTNINYGTQHTGSGNIALTQYFGDNTNVIPSGDAKRLKQYANDEKRRSRDRETALLELAHIWLKKDTSISMRQLRDVRYTMHNINVEMDVDSLTIGKISELYVNRKAMLDSIDAQQQFRDVDWLAAYTELLFTSFQFDRSRFTEKKYNDADHKIRQQVGDLIVERTRFILSDTIWTAVDKESQLDILRESLTKLLIANRIEMRDDDWQLLQVRFGEVNQNRNLNGFRIKELADAMKQIESMRQHASNWNWQQAVFDR